MSERIWDRFLTERDKAVFAAQRYGGFSPLLGQWKEPGPGAPTHNDGEGLSGEGFWIHAQYLGMAYPKCKEIWLPENRFKSSVS